MVWDGSGSDVCDWKAQTKKRVESAKELRPMGKDSDKTKLCKASVKLLEFVILHINLNI